MDTFPSFSRSKKEHRTQSQSTI